MRHLRISALIAALMTFAVLAPPVAAGEQFAYSFHSPNSFEMRHPCTGETVEFVGRYHQVLTMGSDDTGFVRWTSHWDATYVGTDTSGDRYTIRSLDNQVTVYHTNTAPYVTFWTYHATYASSGTDLDFTITMTGRWIWDGQGVWRVGENSFEAQCNDGSVPQYGM
jgi:hypothetical protein